jgi:hypothetical protein
MADAAARLAASAVEQGFPAQVTDPSVLGRIAAVLADGPERTATKKKSRRGLETTATQETRDAARAG